MGKINIAVKIQKRYNGNIVTEFGDREILFEGSQIGWIDKTWRQKINRVNACHVFCVVALRSAGWTRKLLAYRNLIN